MIDPKELAKGGFGAAAALRQERKEREAARQQEVSVAGSEPSPASAKQSPNGTTPPPGVDEPTQQPASQPGVTPKQSESV